MSYSTLENAVQIGAHPKNNNQMAGIQFMQLETVRIEVYVEIL